MYFYELLQYSIKYTNKKIFAYHDVGLHNKIEIFVFDIRIHIISFYTKMFELNW